MDWVKIAKVLLILELIFMFFAFLFIIRFAFADTVGIGVTPAVVKYNFPGVYYKEFCFFNQGDTDAVYTIQSGDIKVDEISFKVPANTDYNNCTKKTLRLIVDKSGYFYVAAHPDINQTSTVTIVRRVGVKVELQYSATTTTTTTSGSGSFISQTTTTTTIANQTLSNVSSNVSLNQTLNETFISNITSSATFNETNQTFASENNQKTNWSALITIVIILVFTIIFYYVLTAIFG